ncbi:uncharacterized protein [Manis javanica]|uniref:uncharacterized protein n=1 Tax=Manis javanica TaxID=9974 RepID=UPI003C6D6A50
MDANPPLISVIASEDEEEIQCKPKEGAGAPAKGHVGVGAPSLVDGEFWEDGGLEPRQPGDRQQTLYRPTLMCCSDRSEGEGLAPGRETALGCSLSACLELLAGFPWLGAGAWHQVRDAKAPLTRAPPIIAATTAPEPGSRSREGDAPRGSAAVCRGAPSPGEPPAPRRAAALARAFALRPGPEWPQPSAWRPEPRLRKQPSRSRSRASEWQGPWNLRRAQRRICRRTQPPRVRTQDMEPLPPCRREFACFRRREAEDDREELREARPAEGGEQEGDGGDHGGQAPGLVEVRNLEAVGTGSGEAREPGEAGQEELPAQAAIGDPEPREEPQRAQRHLSTYSQLLLMEYVFQHTGYPSMALRQELAGIVDVPEATVQVWFRRRRAIWRRQQRPLRFRLPHPVLLGRTTVLTLFGLCDASVLQELDVIWVLPEPGPLRQPLLNLRDFPPLVLPVLPWILPRRLPRAWP